MVVVLSVVLEVVEEPLSLLLHEMTVRQKNMEKMMCICFIWFTIGELGEPKI